MRILNAILGATVALAMVGAMPAGANELRVGLANEPTAIDPHYHNLTPNNALTASIFDTLILQDDRQRLLPGLATSWKALDSTTWEFELRQGVKWHDGKPFTADDVAFSFARAPEVPNSPSSFATFTKGKTVTAIDDFTIALHPMARRWRPCEHLNVTGKRPTRPRDRLCEDRTASRELRHVPSSVAIAKREEIGANRIERNQQDIGRRFLPPA